MAPNDDIHLKTVNTVVRNPLLGSSSASKSATTLLAAGLFAGLFGPHAAQDFDNGIECMKWAALAYWASTAWACFSAPSSAKRRSRRKVFTIAAIGGAPGLSVFTPLLDGLQGHPKLLGLVSFLYYLFAISMLFAAWIVAAVEQDKCQEQASAG